MEELVGAVLLDAGAVLAEAEGVVAVAVFFFFLEVERKEKERERREGEIRRSKKKPKPKIEIAAATPFSRSPFFFFSNCAPRFSHSKASAFARSKHGSDERTP